MSVISVRAVMHFNLKKGLGRGNTGNALGNPRQSSILDCRYQSLSVALGFWIPVVSGIPDP